MLTSSHLYKKKTPNHISLTYTTIGLHHHQHTLTPITPPSKPPQYSFLRCVDIVAIMKKMLQIHQIWATLGMWSIHIGYITFFHHHSLRCILTLALIVVLPHPNKIIWSETWYKHKPTRVGESLLRSSSSTFSAYSWTHTHKHAIICGWSKFSLS